MESDKRTDEPVRPKLFDGLGTRRFWFVTGALAFLALAVLFFKYERVSASDAPVPIVTLTGPSEAAPGETARYAVLVRDRFGAPMPNVSVMLGFARYGITEVARGTTGPGGEAVVVVRFPEDFDEQRVLRASAEASIAEGFGDLYVKPRTTGRPSVFVTTDKPLYQPGQTIHIRGLAMADDKPIAQRPAIIEVRTEVVTKTL